MHPVTEKWFADRTFQEPAWTSSYLIAAKAGRRVSVVLPALDEEETVGAIVRAIVPLTRGDAPLVDELVVVDSGSTDRTIAVATEAGARVVRRTDVVPHLEPLPGKGEVLWRSLAATTGDVIVFIDSDLVDFDPAFVPSLLGPILTRPGVGLVKGFYRRPLRLETTEEESLEHGGGRVTELLARPLLNAFWPELSGFVQPLSGEYAGRRELLERVPFVSGYGVEFGLLVDLAGLAGVDALAQVDLGTRQHAHQSDAALGRMAGQILQTAMARRPGAGDPASQLLQFLRTTDGVEAVSWDVAVSERPPMATVRAAASGGR